MDRNEEIKKVSELLYNDYIGKGWKNVSTEGCERQAINYIDVRDLVKKLTLTDVSQRSELLPDFLYKDDFGIKIGYHGDTEVSEEWNDYLKKLGNCD